MSQQKSNIHLIFKIFCYISLACISLLVLSILLIQIPYIQTKLATYASRIVSQKTGLDISIGEVAIDFRTQVQLNNILLKDHQKDTMIFVRNFNTKYSILSISKKSVLNEEVALSGVRVYLTKGADSIFNHEKVFQVDKTKKSTDKTNKSSSNFFDNFDFKKLSVEDFKLVLSNIPRKQDITISTLSLRADISDFNIHHPIVKVSSLDLNELNIGFLIKNRPKNTDKEVPEYLDLPLNIDIEKLNVSEGKFTVRDYNFIDKSASHHLALNDIKVQHINIDAHKVSMRKHKLDANINHFNCQEQSGLEIKEIATKFHLTSQQMFADNLTFKTNKSTFIGSLTFDYNHMIDYLHFCDKVMIKAHFAKSEFHVSDLVFFVQSLQPYQNDFIHFTSDFNGLLNHLTLSKLSARINNNTILLGTIAVHSLFPIANLKLNANITEFITKKSDIESYVPNLKLPDDISKFGAIAYKGTFEGSPFDFECNGTVSTNLGQAILHHAKLNIVNRNNPKYSGGFKLINFKLAELTSINPTIDNINCDLEIQGSGFHLNDLNSNIKGIVSEINVNQATYRNIIVDGHYANNTFDGAIDSRDSSLRFKTSGKIVLNQQNSDIKMNVHFDKLDLQKLKITNRNLFLQSDVSVNCKGKNIDELLGTIDLSNVQISEIFDDYTKKYNFSNINLQSTINDQNNKSIDIQSEEINASMKGNFKLSELGVVMQEYVLGYLQFEDYRKEKALKSNTFFDATISLNNIGNYSTLFVKNLKNVDSGNLTLSYNGIENKMNINGNFVNTTYGNFFVPHISIANSATLSNFLTNIDFDNIYMNDKLAIDPLKINIVNKEKGLLLHAEMLQRSNPKFIDFNLMASKIENEYLFKILPFTSYDNRQVWNVDASNIVKYNHEAKKITFDHLNISKNNQEVSINSLLNDGANNMVNIAFNDVLLNELISGFVPNLKIIKGNINGHLAINNLLNNPTPIANIVIKDIILNNDTIGQAKIESSYENDILNTKLNLNGKSIDLDLKGTYNTNPKIDTIYSNLIINQFNPKILNNYLKDYMYESSGNIKSNILILGSIYKPQILGELIIDSLHTTINTIHTRYHFINQKVQLLPNQFVFSHLIFKDDYGNQASGYGYIKHKNLANFVLDLNVNSDNIFCLNTTNLNNKSFYGQVFAKLNVDFVGAIDDRITIKAEGKNNDNSKITIAFNNTQQLEKYNFYEFIDKSPQLKTKKTIERKKKLSGVNLDFDFDVNEKGKLSIIMDPTVDDKIDCNGTGKLAFKMTPETDMDIKGSYSINSGYYKFTYKNFIQRVFYFNQGGKISFTGDPYQSVIDAEAMYKARANAQDLVYAYYGESTNANIVSAAKNTVKANVTLKMKNKLTQPDISYAIDIEQNNPTLQSAFESIKAITANNPDELNRQVFYLLAFQRFYPPNVSGFEKVNNNNVGRDAQNIAMDVVAGKLSSYFSDWVANSIKGMNFDFGYKNYVQADNSINTSSIRNNLKLALSQKLFNDRLIFNAGGNYDFGGSSQSNNSNPSYFGGDFDLEYLFSPSGEFRAKFYTTLDNDPINAKYINKTGVGVLYRKDFDNLIEFLQKKKSKKINETK